MQPHCSFGYNNIKIFIFVQIPIDQLEKNCDLILSTYFLRFSESCVSRASSSGLVSSASTLSLQLLKKNSKSMKYNKCNSSRNLTMKDTKSSLWWVFSIVS